MDKITLKLLKALYKQNKLSRDKLNKITNFNLGEGYSNPYVSVLFSNKYASQVIIGVGQNGYEISDGSIEITLLGRSYLENLRKENFDRRYPKIISTIALLISVPAFVMSLIAVLLLLQQTKQ